MTDPLQIALITGLSGAGRSTAADDLEDQGWYVIDNLPVSLIPEVGSRVGIALLVLGFMHFFNMVLISRIGPRVSAWAEGQAPAPEA